MATQLRDGERLLGIREREGKSFYEIMRPIPDKAVRVLVEGTVPVGGFRDSANVQVTLDSGGPVVVHVRDIEDAVRYEPVPDPAPAASTGWPGPPDPNAQRLGGGNPVQTP